MSETHGHPNYIKIWYWLLILLVISTVGPMLEIPVIIQSTEQFYIVDLQIS